MDKNTDWVSKRCVASSIYFNGGCGLFLCNPAPVPQPSGTHSKKNKKMPVFPTVSSRMVLERVPDKNGIGCRMKKYYASNRSFIELMINRIHYPKKELQFLRAKKSEKRFIIMNGGFR